MVKNIKTASLMLSTTRETCSSYGVSKKSSRCFIKTIPVALRILGKDNEVTLALQWNYGEVLYEDPAATLDDLREAVETLEETDRTARRVLGGTHPTTGGVARHLRSARAALAARETPQPAEELEEIDQS